MIDIISLVSRELPMSNYDDDDFIESEEDVFLGSDLEDDLDENLDEINIDLEEDGNLEEEEDEEEDEDKKDYKTRSKIDKIELEEEFEDDDSSIDDEIQNPDIADYTETVEQVAEFKAGKNPYKTNQFLNKFEYSRIVGTRATQIQYGAPPLINLVNKDGTILRSPLEIAEEELKRGKLPLTIERPLPSKIPHKYIYETRPISTLIVDIN